MVSQIINLYGTQVLGTLLVALFGALGMAAKKIAERVLDTPLKAQLARIAVQCVEQTLTHLRSEEKLSAALEALEELLAARGIGATQEEMRILIEAALAEFNDVFRREAA